MESKIYRQKGYNDKYPEEIETWRLGEKVPEWLSDIAKVEDMTEEGPVLKIRKTNTGGYELLDSAGQTVLIKALRDEDFICRAGNSLLVLTPAQLKLLYYDR